MFFLQRHRITEVLTPKRPRRLHTYFVQGTHTNTHTHTHVRLRQRSEKDTSTHTYAYDSAAQGQKHADTLTHIETWHFAGTHNNTTAAYTHKVIKTGAVERICVYERIRSQRKVYDFRDNELTRHRRLSNAAPYGKDSLMICYRHTNTQTHRHTHTHTHTHTRTLRQRSEKDRST